jgi:DNA-binding MarR family transcriptional regulator
VSEPEDKLSELEDSESDHVDQVRALWAQVRPDLDTSSIAVIARLGRVAAYMDAGINARLADFGLTRNAWDVLASLRRSGPPYRLSPTELYRALMRSSGAITHRLAELQHAGLITRVSDPADGRGLLVELTREGLALVDRVAPAHLANERELLEPLTEDEQATLAALLRKRLLAFEQTQPAPPPSGVGGRRRRHRKRRR